MAKPAMTQRNRYSPEPENPQAFTDGFDRFYTRLARAYDWGIKTFPVWRRWIAHVLPHVAGPRVLEISFGTGWLLGQYGEGLEVHALEYNQRLIEVARSNLGQRAGKIAFSRGDVAHLPYAGGVFDSIVNTMAFSGYPDAQVAIREMNRVLKPGGRLLLVDVDYPLDGNWLGRQAARTWLVLGDLLRDMAPIFDQGGFEYEQQEIGGWGSVHLYLATKAGESLRQTS